MILDPDGWVYWVICPELRKLPSTAERKEAIRRAKRAVMTSRWFWPFLVLFVLIAMSGWKLAEKITAPLSFLGFAIFYIALVTTLYILILSWLYGKSLRRTIREQLVRSGIVVCINCGYSLTGLRTAQCPECGEHFDHELLNVCADADSADP